MSKRGRRAQASFEYIAIYGWATLIILASLGALYSFDLLNFNGFVGDKCTFYGQVGCLESQVTADEFDTGDVIVILQNKFSEEIILHNYTIEDEFFSCRDLPNADILWGVNDNLQLNFTNCGADPDDDFVVGTRTDSTITIFYYRNTTVCNSGSLPQTCLLKTEGRLEQTIRESP